MLRIGRGRVDAALVVGGLDPVAPVGAHDRGQHQAADGDHQGHARHDEQGDVGVHAAGTILVRSWSSGPRRGDPARRPGCGGSGA